MPKEDGSNSGVFAVSMSVVGIVLALSAFPLGFIGGFACSLLGLIFGIIQFRSNNNGWAKSALVLSILGLIVNGIIAYVLGAAVSAAVEQYEQLQASGLIEDVKLAADLAGEIGGYAQ